MPNPSQSAATIITPIAAGQVEPLSALLQSIGDDIDANPHLPFARLTSAHFLSWFIVYRDGYGPNLFLELNVDGPIAEFLRSLAAEAGPGLDLIYAHCTGYPAAGSKAPGEVVQYLLAGDVGYDCFYVGLPGLTAGRIGQERGLRDRIEDFLDGKGHAALAGQAPGAIAGMIRSFVGADPALAWSATVPPRPFLVRYRDQVVAALVAITALVVIGTSALVLHRYGAWPLVVAGVVLTLLVAGFLALLRWHEATDSVSDAEPDHSHVGTVVAFENFVIQNHFVSVADVKPGLFRWVLLKSVLKLIHIVGRLYFNRGALGKISSIHFARWAVIDGGRKLLFLSNYDGSWENYLDDFIDKASSGLTAIWSNTVGFPRSRFLVQGGAQDEFLFKTLARHSQFRSLVWYSAYPDLIVQNIQANAAIREGLATTMGGAAELDWLGNF